MQAADILSCKGSVVYNINPDATVFDAVSLMAKHNVGALPVMAGKKLMGIVSERDYRNKVVLKGRTSRDMLVKEIMTTEVLCVAPDEQLENCMAIMTGQKIRHLPVMKNNEVVGIVSIGDLVKNIIDKQKIEIKNLKDYIAGSYPI